MFGVQRGVMSGSVGCGLVTCVNVAGRVPVAPDVDPGTPGVNALGYAERGQTWGGSSGSATWSSAAPDVSASSSGGVRRLEIELLKASPSSAPLPILMFTDAEYLGHA